MNQYFKNFILCGDIDHHCLLCQESFTTIEQVAKHIRWENHRSAIKTKTFLPKFKQDFIYKLGNYIYCGICNLVLQNVSDICVHINDENHKSNKSTPAPPTKTVGRYDVGFVIVDKMVISPQMWHGIDDKHCIVCDTSIENGKEHMESQDHIINLIQSKVKCEGKHYYRVINKDKFQCFTCKNNFPIKHIVEHWTSAEHLGYRSGDELNDAKTKGDKNTDFKVIDKKVDNKKALEKLIDTQRMFYDIDIDSNSAVCKECKQPINVNFKDMIVHTNDHKDNNGSDDSSDEVVYVEVNDHGKRRSELSKYGKEHSIRLNAGGSKGYCMICDSYLSAHKKVFKYHMKGNIHQGLMELKSGQNGERLNKELKFKSFMDCLLIYITDLGEFVVNGKQCISKYSMVFLSRIIDEPQYKKTKCYCCDIYMAHGDEEEHCNTKEHKAGVLDAKVIIMTTEFIREIKPNLYHCGYCNKVFPYWKNLKSHLQSFKHIGVRVYNNNISAKIAQQFSQEIPKLDIIPRDDPNILYSQLMKIICK